MALYAGAVAGPGMERIYRDGTHVVIATLADLGEGYIDGKRYHVRRRHADGTYECTVRKLSRDSNGRWWAETETDDPAHKEALPLHDGDGNELIEVVGRVVCSWSWE
jgi:hypothetical protein